MKRAKEIKEELDNLQIKAYELRYENDSYNEEEYAELRLRCKILYENLKRAIIAENLGECLEMLKEYNGRRCPETASREITKKRNKFFRVVREDYRTRIYLGDTRYTSSVEVIGDYRKSVFYGDRICVAGLTAEDFTAVAVHEYVEDIDARIAEIRTARAAEQAAVDALNKAREKVRSLLPYGMA